jgi:hypothetical protein
MVDRLTSIVRPVCRYQCSKLTCTWVGNLPMEPPPPPPDWENTDLGPNTDLGRSG